MKTTPKTNATMTTETKTTAADLERGVLGHKREVTTWEYQGYTLIREVGEDWPPAMELWSVRSPHYLPDVYEITLNSAEYGVNWAGCGTKSVDEAIKYAEQIQVAAAVANEFTYIRKQLAS